MRDGGMLAKGAARAHTGHCARVTANFLGLEHDHNSGQVGRRSRKCHGKGQLGSDGLAGCLNFTPHNWEANKGFKRAVTASGEDGTIY